MGDNELKSIWKKAGQPETTSGELDKVYEITKKKSVSVIGRFKRVIIGETMVGTLIFVLLGVNLVANHDWYWLGLLIALAAFQYYYFTYDILARINQLDYSQPLTVYLVKARNIIAKYVRFYKVVTYAALPLGFVLGAVKAFQGQHGGMHLKGIVLFLLVFAVFVMGFSALVTWYINKFYGQKVTMLNQLLAELDIEE